MRVAAIYDIHGNLPALEAVLQDIRESKVDGAADKAANLARWKSLHRQLPDFGRLAYPVHTKVTMYVLPGCKSLGCPTGRLVAVGTTWEASKLRGLNIMKYLQPRNRSPWEVAYME